MKPIDKINRYRAENPYSNETRAARKLETEHRNRSITSEQVIAHFGIPPEVWSKLPASTRIGYSHRFKSETDNG